MEREGWGKKTQILSVETVEIYYDNQNVQHIFRITKGVRLSCCKMLLCLWLDFARGKIDLACTWRPRKENIKSYSLRKSVVTIWHAKKFIFCFLLFYSALRLSICLVDLLVIIYKCLLFNSKTRFSGTRDADAFAQVLSFDASLRVWFRRWWGKWKEKNLLCTLVVSEWTSAHFGICWLKIR
jgi:hypothetical protein